MNRFFVQLSLLLVALLQPYTPAWAGALDDYYLWQFGEPKVVQLQKALLSVTPEAQDSARCGMPLKHGLRRDWSLLEQATQKALAKQLALPVLAGEATYRSSGGHFLIHYATLGSDAPILSDNNGNSIPDWVETVAATFENVYSSYVAQGYQPAPSNSGAYDIVLRDLAPQGFYGVTNSDQPMASARYANAFTSWMELDNNFTDPIYKPAIYTPLQSLQITAAHEYHHAIQYGYSFYFDIWYAEATSTWMEDELYDDVNQLYNYISSWFFNSTRALDIAVESNAISSGAGYSRWLFNRYLAEKHGPALIRSLWEKLGTLNSPGNNADIPMAPVIDGVLANSYGSTLGNDFFELTKRVYTKAWATHTSEIDKIRDYAPVAVYAAYPVNSSKNPGATITLPHYAFAYSRFTPAPGMSSLTITITRSGGIRTAAYKKSSGSGIISEISADAGGNSYTDTAFAGSDEVVLLIANVTSTDGESASISTDGSISAITAGTTTPPPTASSTSSNSGGGKGCFIATAAYGSYLHPQVQLLRDFRDMHLLTNAPGRALVTCYYRFSPPLADFIARHPLLRGVTRLALTPIIAAVVHPVAAGVGVLLTLMLLYRPVRRRCLERIAL